MTSQAPLELFVNTVDRGTAIVRFQGDAILVARDDLAKAGLNIGRATEETIDGKAFVRLASLAPRVTYRYDETNLSLKLTVDPLLLGISSFDLSNNGPPADMIRRGATSAFLNYAINSSLTGAVNTGSLFTEQGASFWGTFFDNSVTLDSNGQVSRGQTSFTIDDVDRLTRLTVGDMTAAGGTLAGPVSMGGVGYSKNFAIDPYLIPYPTQRYAGVVNTPSTANIYVNGQLVRTVDLPPGQFNLTNIPGALGAGVTRVVIRDAFGQQQELGAPYYRTTQLLREGLEQYSYDIGMVRTSLADSGFGEYARPAFNAFHRIGLSDQVTLGGFIEADPQLVVGGPELAFDSPLGQFGVFGAASSAAGAPGWSGSAQYSYQTGRFSIGTDVTYESGRFSTLSLRPGDDRPRVQYDAFASLYFTNDIDLVGQYSHAHYRDTGVNDQASVTLTDRLTSRFNVSFTAGQSRSEHSPVDSRVLLSLSYLFGSASIATLSGGYEQHGVQTTAQLQKSLPYGTGYGYSLQAQSGRQAVQSADLQYQSSFGNYEVQATQQASQTIGRVSLSGSIVAIGDEVVPSRALTDSYALVRVPGVKDVTTYLSNQEIGRTDEKGDLLIPNMLAYYGNRLSINDQDVPLDYVIDSTVRVAAPPYRSGAVVEFPVRRLRAYVGNLVVEGEGRTIVPAYGDLTVDVNGKPATSPIGARGEFYLEGLPAGKFNATVVYDGGECTFEFVAPRSSDRFVKMGQVACVRGGSVFDQSLRAVPAPPALAAVQPPPPVSQPAPPPASRRNAAPIGISRAAVKTVSPAGAGRIYIQAGAFAVAGNADRLSATLSRLGKTGISPALIRGTKFYRVRVGPVGSLDEARLLLARVVESGAANAAIVVDRSAVAGGDGS